MYDHFLFTIFACTINHQQNTESIPRNKDTVDGQEWDSTGARQLMELTREFAPPGLIYGFELGNEVEHGNLQMDLARLGRAYGELRSIVAEIWPEADARPKLLGPATSGSNYKKYLPYIGEFLDIVTYHKYQHSGQDLDLMNLVLQPDFLWKTEEYSREVRPGYDEFGVKEIWIGEGALASHSGQSGVTDTFASSLWFANALGSMAKAQPLPISTFCRQTLIGGHYGLLSQPSLDPNPDFYMMRLWKHLVGQQTLGSIESTIKNQELLRVHSFCGVEPGKVVLVFVSIDENERSIHVPMGSHREVYQLKGEPDVQGNQVLLNGVLQYMTDDGSLPEMTPVTEPREQELVIPPLSVTFAVLHETGIAACGSSPHLSPPTTAIELPPVESSVQEQVEAVSSTTPPMSPPQDAPPIPSQTPLFLIWALVVTTLNIMIALALRRHPQSKRRHTELTEIESFELDMGIDSSSEEDGDLDDDGHKQENDQLV